MSRKSSSALRQAKGSRPRPVHVCMFIEGPLTERVGLQLPTMRPIAAPAGTLYLPNEIGARENPPKTSVLHRRDIEYEGSGDELELKTDRQALSRAYSHSGGCRSSGSRTEEMVGKF